jgi:predicted DNA-binding protein (MmcQ/YjbR family)
MKAIANLAAYCRKLPHATEDIKWGKDLVFSIGGKMFACFDNENFLQFSFKTTPDNFERLTKLDGIIPAPYVARYHWVAINKANALPADVVKELLRASYDLVADKLPSRVRKQLGLDG